MEETEEKGRWDRVGGKRWIMEGTVKKRGSRRKVNEGRRGWDGEENDISNLNGRL